MLAFSTVSSDARPLPSPSLSVPAFLHSVMPALDGAFGLEGDPDLPVRLAALVARLEEGREPVTTDHAAVVSVVPMPRPNPDRAAEACDDTVLGPDAATTLQPVPQPFQSPLPVAA